MFRDRKPTKMRVLCVLCICVRGIYLLDATYTYTDTHRSHSVDCSCYHTEWWHHKSMLWANLDKDITVAAHITNHFLILFRYKIDISEYRQKDNSQSIDQMRVHLLLSILRLQAKKSKSAASYFFSSCLRMCTVKYHSNSSANLSALLTNMNCVFFVIWWLPKEFLHIFVPLLVIIYYLRCPIMLLVFCVIGTNTCTCVQTHTLLIYGVPASASRFNCTCW